MCENALGRLRRQRGPRFAYLGSQAMEQRLVVSQAWATLVDQSGLSYVSSVYPDLSRFVKHHDRPRELSAGAGSEDCIPRNAMIGPFCPCIFS